MVVPLLLVAMPVAVVVVLVVVMLLLLVLIVMMVILVVLQVPVALMVLLSLWSDQTYSACISSGNKMRQQVRVLHPKDSGRKLHDTDI